MEKIFSRSNRDRTGFINRLGGLAILLGFGIHIVANMVLKTFPPKDISAAELEAYLIDEHGNWAIIHGVRYIAIVCIVLFAAALYSRVLDRNQKGTLFWGIAGLIGTVLMTVNLLITNGIEILAFSDYEYLAGNVDLFWMLFHLTRVLFTGEILAWGILIFGFSMAGMISATLPRWLTILGWVSSVFCVMSTVFIYSVLQEGWASVLITVAGFSGLIWFVCTGAYLVVRPILGQM